VDKLDIQNATMVGVGMYQEWKRQFLSDFQENIQKGQIKQAFAMMPAEMKEMLKQRDPQGYERVLAMLEGD